MACGAGYDLCFAVAILLFTDPAAALMGLVVPLDPIYLKLNGLFLLLLAALYALPTFAPRRYSGVVAVAAAGRMLGFLFFGAAWLAGAPAVFLVLGTVDLLFGVVHAILLWRATRPSAQPAQNKGA